MWACTLTQSIRRQRLEKLSFVIASQNEQPCSFVPSSDEELPQAQACSRAVRALAPLSGPSAASSSSSSSSLIPCPLHPPLYTLASLPPFLLACSLRLLQGGKLSLLFLPLLLAPTVSAGNPPSWALTTAVIAEQQLQIPQCNITAVFRELKPAVPPIAKAPKTES